MIRRFRYLLPKWYFNYKSLTSNLLCTLLMFYLWFCYWNDCRNYSEWTSPESSLEEQDYGKQIPQSETVKSHLIFHLLSKQYSVLLPFWFLNVIFLDNTKEICILMTLRKCPGKKREVLFKTFPLGELTARLSPRPKLLSKDLPAGGGASARWGLQGSPLKIMVKVAANWP